MKPWNGSLSRFAAVAALLLAPSGPAAAQASDPYEVGGVQCSTDDATESRVRFRVEADLNSDGTPDYLLAMAPCGNAGCSFSVVISTDDGYRAAGRVFFHPLAARLERLPSGVTSLKAYIRGDAQSGSLTTYEISHTGAHTLSEQTMQPTSTDAEQYRALFGPEVRAKAERGRCEQSLARLTWSPYQGEPGS